MVLHELVTNAVKYGALATEQGKVDVTWGAETRAGGRTLVFDWREDAGRPIEPPQRAGFGSSPLRRSGVYELDGAVDSGLLPDGGRCPLEAPDRQSVAAGKS